MADIKIYQGNQIGGCVTVIATKNQGTTKIDDTMIFEKKSKRK